MQSSKEMKLYIEEEAAARNTSGLEVYTKQK